MGKVILAVALILAAAFLIYRRFEQPVSEELRMVKAVEVRFDTATAKYMGSGKTSGTMAALAVEETERAVNDLKRIKSEFDEMMPALTEQKAVARAERLSRRIEEFFFKNEIR